MSSWFGVGQPYGSGQSFQESIRGTAPAAGASFSHQLDSRYRSRLLSAVWTLTTDANAANRYVTLEYQGSDNLALLVMAAAVTVSANSTQRFAGSIDRGQSEWAANTDVLIPVVPVLLDAGNALKINVANIQAGDTLTSIRLIFDRFPTSPSNWPGDEG